MGTTISAVQTKSWQQIISHFLDTIPIAMASTKIKSRDSGKKDKSVKTKKQTKKTPPPTTYKSEEFVQDSDEDEENNGPAEDNSEESSDSDSSLSSAKPSLRRKANCLHPREAAAQVKVKIATRAARTRKSPKMLPSRPHYQ